MVFVVDCMLCRVRWLRIMDQPIHAASYYEFSNTCKRLSISVLCGKDELHYGILTPNYAFAAFNLGRTATYTLNYGREWYLKNEVKVYVKHIMYLISRPRIIEFYGLYAQIGYTRFFTAYLFMNQVLSYYRNRKQSTSPPPTSFIL